MVDSHSHLSLEHWKPALLWWYFGSLSPAPACRIKVKEEFTGSSRKDGQITEKKLLLYDKGESCTEVFCRRAYKLEGQTTPGLQILRILLLSHFTYCLDWLFIFLWAMLNIFPFGFDFVSSFAGFLWLFGDHWTNYSSQKQITRRQNMPSQK